jgi:hypothetical protein
MSCRFCIGGIPLSRCACMPYPDKPCKSYAQMSSFRANGPCTISVLAGHIIYTLNEAGLVQTQEQTWSKPAATALLESFTPTSGPRSDIAKLQ